MGNLVDKFDDVVTDEGSLWSQICEECVERLGVDRGYLDEGAGTGICGVRGCSNDADHYIDFKN